MNDRLITHSGLGFGNKWETLLAKYVSPLIMNVKINSTQAITNLPVEENSNWRKIIKLAMNVVLATNIGSHKKSMSERPYSNAKGGMKAYMELWELELNEPVMSQKAAHKI